MYYFDLEAFGQRLRALRTNAGFTQEDVANKLNISLNHYSFLERGKRSCSIELLMDLADLFHVTERYLLRGETEAIDSSRNKLQNIADQLLAVIQDM